MKPISFVLIFFLLLLLLLSSTSARLYLPPKQEEKEVKSTDGSFTERKEDVSTLMGLEEYECEEGDEECLKRRMVAEAHLDYIYTQHHKKP
ncbi:hypothetical protein P3X46_009572 [Hevea brasiliensis]|uniref:Phytosulfokine n=1 Tax=Hevea brasiliensis TaxID=3981 RepID=A0ABQ9MP54_HEVBR|nr:putative phytosulfokines 6 [Hevea brasiliensis]KAJ9181440.1 hypothetical protein P3X46_009572 [Hevea brasiliensis]